MSTLLTDGMLGPLLLLDGMGVGVTAQLGTWAAIGTTLTIDADGTVTGNTFWSAVAGDSHGITITGTPFEEGLIAYATLTLYVPEASAPPLMAIPYPTGLTDAGYAATWIVPGTDTAIMPSSATYAIRLYGAGGDLGTVVVGRFRIEPAPTMPAPPPGAQVLRRGTADTVTLTFTNADGSAYSLANLSLVWTMGVLTKTQAAGQILVGTPASGVAIVQLSSTDTAALAAGTLPFTVTDATSGTPLGSGTITVR